MKYMRDMWLDGTSLMLTSAFAASPLHRSCLRHSRSLVFTTHGKEAGSGQHGDRMRQVTRRKGDPPRPLRLRSRSSCPHFSLTPPFDPTPCHLLPIPPSFPSPLPLLPSLRLPSLPFHFLSLSNGLRVYPYPTRTDRVGYERHVYGYTRILLKNN